VRQSYRAIFIWKTLKNLEWRKIAEVTGSRQNVGKVVDMSGVVYFWESLNLIFGYDHKTSCV